MRLIHEINTKTEKFPTFASAMTLILLADSIMVYMFPIILEQELGSNTLMGIIMALSSAVGIMIDLILPSFLRANSWKKLLVVGCIVSAFFPLTTIWGSHFQAFALFFMASIIWGIYYEFISFSQQSYIAEEEAGGGYAKDWGIMTVLWQVVLVISPIIGAFLLTEEDHVFLISLLFIQLAALIIAILIPRKRETQRVQSKTRAFFRILREYKIYGALLPRMYTLFLTTFIISAFSAALYTLGGLYGEQLNESNGIPQWLILALSNTAILLGSSFLIKFPVEKNKKKVVLTSVMVSGIILTVLAFIAHMPLLICILFFVSTLAFSVAQPINEAVYSDLSHRNKDIEFAILSFSRMGISLSYILVPLILGFLADGLGYQKTFGLIGIFVAVAALILLALTPKKLKLPQKQIKEIIEDVA